MSRQRSGGCLCHESPGLRWLRSKRWAEVTREERFCCAELYSLIRRDVLRFIDYQNVHHLAGLDAGANWEVVFKLVSIKGARCPGSAAKRLAYAARRGRTAYAANVTFGSARRSASSAGFEACQHSEDRLGISPAWSIPRRTRLDRANGPELRRMRRTSCMRPTSATCASALLRQAARLLSSCSLPVCLPVV